MNGVAVDEEQLALDAVQRVGADGNYIGDEHTLKHFREVWYPRYLDRRNFDSWAAAGGKTMGQRLDEKVSDILAKHVPVALAPVSSSAK